MKSLSLSSIALVFTLTFLSSVSARAEYASYWRWEHKFGSDIVGLVAHGSDRSFVMLKNESGITNWHANRVVFAGTKQGNHYVGSFHDHYGIPCNGQVSHCGNGVSFWLNEGMAAGQNKFVFVSKLAPAGLWEQPGCDGGHGHGGQPQYSSYWNYMGDKLGLVAHGNQRKLVSLGTGATVFTGVKSGNQYVGELHSNGHSNYCVASILNDGGAINFNGNVAWFAHH